MENTRNKIISTTGSEPISMNPNIMNQIDKIKINQLLHMIFSGNLVNFIDDLVEDLKVNDYFITADKVTLLYNGEKVVEMPLTKAVELYNKYKLNTP